MKIAESTLQAVKDVSLVDIVSQYVDLKRHGSEWRGVCPFHEERTPSFSVNPLKGYKCFGCDAGGGDAIAFIMALESKSFPDAVIRVASIAGIYIEEVEGFVNQPKPIIKKREFVSKPVSYIPIDLFKNSLQGFEENRFVIFLIHLFGPKIAQELIDKYFIGSNDRWKGGTIFWQIDIVGKIRSGKIMLYDSINGKRVKKPFDHFGWVHKELSQEDFELKQCFFGEHLLANNKLPIAIVESEKTAIIASVYYPEIIWLACGGLTNLNLEKCKVLQGRDVILYPDLNGFEVWSLKAKELSELMPGTEFNVSELLNDMANEEEVSDKLDLADYLIAYNRRVYEGMESFALWREENKSGGIFEFEGKKFSIKEKPHQN